MKTLRVDDFGAWSREYVDKISLKGFTLYCEDCGIKRYLKVVDDRTHILLCVDGKDKYIVHYHPGGMPLYKQCWNSWLDTSTGERITSYEQVKEKEKAGLVFASPEEHRAEARKNKAYNEAKFKQESNQRYMDKLRPVLKKSGINI